MIYDFTKNFSLKLKPKTYLKINLVIPRSTEATQRSSLDGNNIVFFSVYLCVSSVELCISSLIKLFYKKAYFQLKLIEYCLITQVIKEIAGTIAYIIFCTVYDNIGIEPHAFIFFL